MKLAASVIVPTFNRRALLMELLESLGRQTLARERFEVLVIDNGSTDGTEQAVQAFARRLAGLHLEFHVMPVNRGPSVSRNFGASIARGEILFFTDSDVIVDKQWLERGLASFEESADLAMLSGPTVDKPNQPHRFFSVGTNNSYEENPIYPTSNVMYRKSVFEAVGGFEEAEFRGDLAGVALECSDVDLAWKVIDRGCRKAFRADLVVYHEVRVVPLRQWLATQLRVRYVPLILRRHPATRNAFLWFGPFAAPENLFFYLALASLAAAAASRSAWWLVGLLPLYARFHPFLRPSWSPVRWPKMAAQFVLIVLRQTVICGALAYGSIRSRQVVL